MFWSICLCGYLLFGCSSPTSGFQIHSNSDDRAVSVAGDDASLTCYYSPRVSSARGFGGLFWKFSPKSDPTAVIDIASYEASYGIRYSSGLSSKLKLNASWQYGGSLKIMNTSLDDQGKYKCQIGTEMGYDERLITLTVYAVPRVLQISNPTHQHNHPSSSFVTTSDEPQTLVCSSFPPSSPATNLSWDLDPTLERTRNMIQYPQENVTSSWSSSLSSPLSSSSGGWEFFTTERRLVLTPRDDDHGAIIRCYGDHPGLRQRLSASITLSVLVSPSYIRIFDDGFQLLSGTGSVNVTQDSAVTFVCISTRSRPPTFPKWRIGNDLIEDNVTRKNISYGDPDLFDVQSFMTLQRVLREHHGKEVTCSASGLNLRAVATNITLNVLGFPDPPTIAKPTESIIEGRSQSLECTALNGFPPGEIEWLIDGNPTPDTSNTVVKRWRYDVTSHITINPDRDMNGKEATCIVRSPTLSARDIRTFIALNVQFCPHRVSISCEPILAGRSSMLTCTSGLANPAPRLHWTVDGQEIDSISVHHGESPNSSNSTEGFISSSVYSGSFDANDHGKVVRCCAARNEAVGCTTDVCTECPLIVYCKPKLLQERNDMIMSVHEHYITLRCSARGNPTPSMEWYSPWIIRDSPINASTPGVISLVDTIIDRVIQSTLVIESSAGVDTNVQGVKCVASNSIGSSSTTSFFGTTSGVSSVYDRDTGLLTVSYSADSVPTDDLPCVHVDYKLANKQVWKLGTTCFELQTNETVVQVQAGLDSTEIGLRVCFYEEFCNSPLPPEPAFQPSLGTMSNIFFPTLVVGVALSVILCISAALFVYRKKSRKDHEENRHDRSESRRNQVSFRRADQRPHAGVEDAAPSGQCTRGEMNYYMDMTSTGTSQNATTSQTGLMSLFRGGGDVLPYEDMTVGEQPSSPGYAHYMAGSQEVDCSVYANMTTTPLNVLKRSDSGIFSCSYSVSPTHVDSPHLQTNSSPNTYESSIYTAPIKLQMPSKGAADQQDDTYSPVTPEGYFAIPSPSSTTVASEWSFFPIGATSSCNRSSSRESNGAPLYATVPKEVD